MRFVYSVLFLLFFLLFFRSSFRLSFHLLELKPYHMREGNERSRAPMNGRQPTPTEEQKKAKTKE